MSKFLSLAGALALTISNLPAHAGPMSAPTATDGKEASALTQARYRPSPDASGAPDYSNANGGYQVNAYGHGNYYGGPGGGFAGYPAGSAGAQIYRQRQEWKCVQVPEKC